MPSHLPFFPDVIKEIYDKDTSLSIYPKKNIHVPLYVAYNALQSWSIFKDKCGVRPNGSIGQLGS